MAAMADWDEEEEDEWVFGELAKVNRMLEEDGRRLNAQLEQHHALDNYTTGCTPLMLAVWNGQDAVVARLLELGADLTSSDNNRHYTVGQWACVGNHPSTLALLLDAGAPFDHPPFISENLFTTAAYEGAEDCVHYLLDFWGEAFDIDSVDDRGGTAIYYAAWHEQSDLVKRLVEAGANPTIREGNGGWNALDAARWRPHNSYAIALLEQAIAEPQRPRLLFKARALLAAAVAAAVAAPKARQDAADKGEPAAVQQEKALEAAPPYLKGRVAQEQQLLPRVEVAVAAGSGVDGETLRATVAFVLGMEGKGLPHELFVELLEMMVPRWDRARKGMPMGAGGESDDDLEEEGDGGDH